MVDKSKNDKPYTHIPCAKDGRTNAPDDQDDIAECLDCKKPECTNCKQFVYFRAAWKNTELPI